MEDIQVIVADDHHLVRAGICSLLENVTGIKVIAQADDGFQVIELVAKLHPDVVLMDIAMPKINGLEATSKILTDFPEVKVIILSMYVNEEYVWQAMRSRASGYLLKDAAPVELERAIKSVMDGSVYLSPEVSHHVVNDYIRRVNGKFSSTDKITPRQREIWKMLAEGLSAKEIAAHLSISVKTVETHRTQLMERLGTRDLISLVKLAIKEGIISSEK